MGHMPLKISVRFSPITLATALLTMDHEGLNYPVASGAHLNPQEGIEREEYISCLRRFGHSRLVSAESGNMVIMLYAYARTSGDGTLLAQYVRCVARSLVDGSQTSLQYNLTKRWADYLVNNALAPQSQCAFFHSPHLNNSHMRYRTAGDGQNSVNMTNLAIKGIIGVKVMAEISRIVNQSSDAQIYDVRCLEPLS